MVKLAVLTLAGLTLNVAFIHNWPLLAVGSGILFAGGIALP